MRYITSSEKEGIQFGDYLNALESYRDRLPTEVAEFAADENRFALNHPSSLHDAWVERIAVTESRSCGESSSGVQIELTLLGQMHDRIVLTYEEVTDYTITGGQNEWSTQDTLHGDIWTHEVRLSDSQEVIHEIVVGSSGKIEVTCGTFKISERLN